MIIEGNWTVKGNDAAGHSFSIPASVPGCVHTDLQRAGLLPDLFWRNQNEEAQWVENCDVTYICEYLLDAVETDMCFDFRGLDVYCSVYSNGILIGEADNMHIPWSFPAKDTLRAGKNILEVRFRSPVREVASLPERPAAFTCERLWTRRIQCTYGWDWVGRFVTMGIWKEVRLESKKPDTFAYGQESIYVYTREVTAYAAQVCVRIDFENITGNAWADMLIQDPDGNTVWSKRRRVLKNTVEELVDIPDARLWYPRGYGDQPLYKLICRSSADEVNEKHVQFGIRKAVILEIEDSPDGKYAAEAARIKKFEQMVEWDRNEGSSCFWLLINDVRVFCRGANWVPCEPFPSAETDDKIQQLVHMAALGGVNMLRVWGGGIFEHAAFYEACDREGILVTQDFLMACGNYPEEYDSFCEQLRKEAKAAALALRNHTCLVWWSGDNENAVRGDENMPDYTGRRAALDCIGPVLAEYDYNRRFLPSSPYGGVPYASGVRGTTHNTQYLGNFFRYVRENDFSGYQEYFNRYLCRFTAEQPAIGMPFVSSLRKFMTEEDIYGDDTSMSEYHTKNNPGLGEITLYGYVERMAKGMFGEFTDGSDRIRKMQRLQCEWIRLSLELFRRHAWFSSGIIYWMFNDCWPAANGWSIVDYYANPKPGFYAFRRAASPVIASVTAGDEAGDDRIRVDVSCSGKKPACGKGRLYRYNIVNGTEDNEITFSIDNIQNESRVMVDTEHIPMDKDTVLLCDIVTDIGSDRAFYMPLRWADMNFTEGSEPAIIAEDENSITVYAEETLPMAFVDDEGILLSDNGMFMKKGETVKLYRKR